MAIKKASIWDNSGRTSPALDLPVGPDDLLGEAAVHVLTHLLPPFSPAPFSLPQGEANVSTLC